MNESEIKMSALQPATAVCGIFVAYMQGALTKQVLKMKLGTIALSFLIHLRLVVATCVICAQAHRPPALCGLHQWRRQRHHHFCHCHRHHRRHCQRHHQIWWVGGFSWKYPLWGTNPQSCL